MYKIAICAFLIFFISSCGKTDEEKLNLEIIDEMGWLYKADPIADAQSFIEKGDFRFRGVYGIARIIPNIEKKCIDIENDVVYIKGTSDALETYEHQKLNAIAKIYAETFNIYMLFYLNENDKYECIS